MRQPILQLEPNPLGGLFAYRGYLREPGDVLHADGAHEVGWLDPRQDRQPEFGTDTADRNQPLEQVLLERRAEPEQRKLILTHVRVNPERHRPPPPPPPPARRE